MTRKSLKQWLADANGWRRIWFVCSVICFIYFIVIYPLSEASKVFSYKFDGFQATEREMKNAVCAPYMSEDFNKLVQPKYSSDGSTCYHIYSHRMFLDDNKPVTEKTYEDDFNSKQREMWLMYIGLGFLISTLLSAFVYSVGFLTSWVIKGFKKSESQ